MCALMSQHTYGGQGQFWIVGSLNTKGSGMSLFVRMGREHPSSWSCLTGPEWCCLQQEVARGEEQ